MSMDGKGMLPLQNEPGTPEYLNEVKSAKAHLAGKAVVQFIDHTDFTLRFRYKIREPGWHVSLPKTRFVTLEVKADIHG